MIKSLGGYWPVVIDIETSGVVANKHAILEIAAIPLVFDGGVWSYSEIWHEHIEPFSGAEFSPEAMAIHGIDVDHPFRKAISEAALFESWRYKLEKIAKINSCSRCMLLGHNAHFDLNFIMAALARCDAKIPLHSFTCFDTATLGAYLYSETVLPKILKKAKIPYSGNSAHSAVYDVEITAKLMVKILNNS